MTIQEENAPVDDIFDDDGEYPWLDEDDYEWVTL